MTSNRMGNIKLQEQLKDITKCCICSETFTDPRILPCVHTFCMKCLEDVGSKSNKKPGQNMPCPLCKREFVIPLGGFTETQKSFFLARNIEIGMSVDLSRSSSRQLCGACLKDVNDPASATQAPLAEMFCAVCCMMLCKNCINIHRKSKLTGSHKLETVEIQSVPVDNHSKLNPEFCQVHESELLKMFCTDCKKVVCSYCYIERHQGHKWSDIGKASGEFCSKIQKHMQSVALRNNELLKKKESMIQAKLDLIAGIESLKLEINQRKALLVETIHKHANLLLMEMDVLRQEKLKLFETEEENIDMQIANEEYYTLYCQEIISKGSVVDVCRDEVRLSKRAVELKDMNASVSHRHLESAQIALQISDLNEFMKDNGNNFVGQVGPTGLSLSTEASQIEVSSSPTDTSEDLNRQALESFHPHEKNERIKCELASGEASRSKVVLTKTHRITGMGIIESELFIATEMRSTIEVYNSLKFNRLRCWSLSGLTNPEDMAASLNPKCLYIFDAIGAGKIYQVNLNGSQISSWISGSTDVRLSVAPDSNVIVTYLGQPRLKEYSSAEKGTCRLIQQLPLQGSSTHTVKLKTGNFLVSRGASVLEIDAHGKDINSFKGKIGSTTERLKCPELVAVDKQGSVLVLDRGNRRVILLDSNLVFQKELISAMHGLQDPTAMVLDDTTCRLFVSSYDSAENLWRILVTDIAFL